MRESPLRAGAIPATTPAMILPSDEDPSPPESTPDKPKGKKKAQQPPMGSNPAPWSDLFKELGVPGKPLSDETDEVWREELKSELLASLEEISGFPDTQSEYDPPEPPDLCTFFSHLIAMRHAQQTAQQQTASLLKRQTDVLRKLTEELKLVRAEQEQSRTAVLCALAELARTLEAHGAAGLAASVWSVHKSLGGVRDISPDV
jgi:hypothetical protein